MKWEPRGTSRLENSGLGLDMGSFQSVRDPGPPRGEEQKGWAVRGCSNQPRVLPRRGRTSNQMGSW